MKRLMRLVGLLAATASVPASAADPAPSVLVTTIAATSGSLPDRIEAYGAAVPATDAMQTLSLPRDGRVRRILHTPGEAVRQGETLLEWEASAIAQQGWEQARSGLALARQQQQHASLLLERHLGTRDQLDQATRALSDAQATMAALQRDGAGRPVQAVSAPFDGTLVSVPVSPGDRVAAGTPLATLARGTGIVVTVGVDPARLSSVHPGQPATVRALYGGPILVASVLRVDASLDPRSRLVNVDLSVSNGSPLPGIDMRAEITVGRLAGWLVPHDAVLQDSSGTVLFQADAGTAHLVRVGVLGMVGDTDVVSGALTPSWPIVRDGASQLADGARLRTNDAP